MSKPLRMAMCLCRLLPSLAAAGLVLMRVQLRAGEGVPAALKTKKKLSLRVPAAVVLVLALAAAGIPRS